MSLCVHTRTGSGGGQRSTLSWSSGTICLAFYTLFSVSYMQWHVWRSEKNLEELMLVFHGVDQRARYTHVNVAVKCHSPPHDSHHSHCGFLNVCSENHPLLENHLLPYLLPTQSTLSCLFPISLPHSPHLVSVFKGTTFLLVYQKSFLSIFKSRAYPSIVLLERYYRTLWFASSGVVRYLFPSLANVIKKALLPPFLSSLE